MKYIAGTIEFQLHNTCVTMGKFDGIHRGHQYLFDELEKSKKKGYISVMFTFDYHPYIFFSGDNLPLIYTEEEKRYLLDKKGPDVLLSFPFSEKTAFMEPEEFIKDILVDRLDARIIAIGEDFRFGRSRRGNADMLKQYADTYGYELKIYKKLRLDNNIISSTLIREQLSAGNIEYVNKLLGNPFTIMGTVVHGNKLGRTLGIPTINLIPQNNKLLPPNGVYFSVTKVGDKSYMGITNIGIKPTVASEMQKWVETYMFNFNKDIYGCYVAIEIHDYHRPEKKFLSIDDLQNQIKSDILSAEAYFKKIEFM